MAATSPERRSSTAARAEPEPSGWIVFAATMLMIAGVFDFFFGLAAVLNAQVVTVGGRGVIVWDFTVWGWVHLLLGVAMIGIALGLFGMRGWARYSAVFIATVNAMFQVTVITAFPLWALLIVALDIIVIYQLTLRWRPEDRV
jgi:hypothetical protein